MSWKGEITVFLAMILVSVSALLCTVVESARTAGARCYMRMAVDSSMDSLMAQYHRGLWKGYRILGLEYDSVQTLEQEMRRFLEPYGGAVNWYPMRTDDIAIKDTVSLTQGEGRYMEQEILDYMKYGLFDTQWDEMDQEGAEKLLSSWKESAGVTRISKLYSGHAREAVQLEKSLEKINARLISQREYWERGRLCLESMDGGGFISQTGKMIRELEKVPGLVTTYEKQADKLEKRLKESRVEYEGQEEELSDSVKQSLEDEIKQYETYISQDGQRRREVAGLKTDSPSRIQWIQNMADIARDVMDYINDWEPEDEDDDLDEEALWRPVLEQWNSYAMLSLGIEFGIKDKEKEGFLEQIGKMAENGLLDLVLPEEAVVSGKNLDLSRSPSVTRGQIGESGTAPEDGDVEAENGIHAIGVRNLLERLLIGEYGIRFFKAFRREMAPEDYYELEYVVNGKGNDRENLAGVVLRLVAFREGLNLVHILSDTGKRQEARELALAIVGGTGILPLVSVMTFFIMAAWALGEALWDVRIMLSEGKVPLFKTAGDWKMGLDSLLQTGKSRRLAEGGQTSGGDGHGGLTYKGYIRILIFGGYKKEMIYRMMDVMQLVIGRDQPGFSMEKCACTVDMETKFRGKHVFFSTGLWKSFSGGDGFTYETDMAVSGSYLEDRWNR